MAINYAEKHSAKVDEAFTIGSITERAVNQDYEFTGVRTIKIHSVPTVDMNDYARSGSNRYGTPAELEDEVQEVACERDRSFTFTVDKGNSEENSALNAGKALRRQVDERVIPEVDRYRLAKMAANAMHTKQGAVSKSNAYELFLTLNGALDDAGAPQTGRIGYVSTTFYNALKQDSSFILASDIAQEMRINGQLGEVDGVAILKSAGRLPKGVDLLLTHPVATVGPKKLSEYKVHQDPPGISGQLVEGREIYDAFVLKNKKGAIGVHRGTLVTLEVTNAAGSSATKTKFTAVTGHTGEGNIPMGKLVYLIASNPTAPELGADISNTTTYPELTLGAEINVTSGHKYIIALKDQNGKCIGVSAKAEVTVGGT